MAKAKKAQIRVSNWRKKRNIPIEANKVFNNAFLGETLVEDAKLLLGRSISSNLMLLTNDMKKQNTTVKFKITNIVNNKAVAEPVGYSIANASIKRLIRRGKARVDISFLCKTKDNRTVRIKPIIITKNCTTKRVLTALRNNCSILITNHIKETNYADLFLDIVNSKLQRNLFDQLKKIYPLKTVEIRALLIEERVKPGQEAVQQESVQEDVVETPAVENTKQEQKTLQI